LTILLHGAYAVGVSRRLPYILKRRALQTSATLLLLTLTL